MPTTEYTHPEWSKAKRNPDNGKVSTKGSFPVRWLDAQDDPTLTDWGITKDVIPDPVPTLPEEKEAAKITLANYYDAYIHSQFDVVGVIFSADQLPTQNYQSLNMFINAEPSNNVNYYVTDIDIEPHPITTKTQWAAFWGAYQGLWNEARDVSLSAWQEVKDATTKAEIDAILGALPPVPGQ